MKNLLKNNIKTITIIILAIVFIFLFKDWFIPKIITSLGGYTTKETKIDTLVLYKKGKVDTLAIFNTYIENNNISFNTKPIIKYKYKYKDPVTNEIGVIDSIKSYTVNVTDSIIEGNAIITNKFNGDLLNFDLKYKPLVPKLLVRVDTISTTINTETILSNERSKIGTGVGYNNLQFLTLSGSYTTKKDLQFILTYGKSVQNTKAVINGTPFVVTPNDYYGLTIIKHW